MALIEVKLVSDNPVCGRASLTVPNTSSFLDNPDHWSTKLSQPGQWMLGASELAKHLLKTCDSGGSDFIDVFLRFFIDPPVPPADDKRTQQQASIRIRFALLHTLQLVGVVANARNADSFSSSASTVLKCLQQKLESQQSLNANNWQGALNVELNDFKQTVMNLLPNDERTTSSQAIDISTIAGDANVLQAIFLSVMKQFEDSLMRILPLHVDEGAPRVCQAFERLSRILIDKKRVLLTTLAFGSIGGCVGWAKGVERSHIVLSEAEPRLAHQLFGDSLNR